MTDNDKMREAFEEHAYCWAPSFTRSGEEYCDDEVNSAWLYFKAGAAWQAAQAEQSAEIERLRKDAERYRWLRSPSVGPATVWRVCMEPMDGGLHTLKSDSCLDAAIDAAIAATKVQDGN